MASGPVFSPCRPPPPGSWQESGRQLLRPQTPGQEPTLTQRDLGACRSRKSLAQQRRDSAAPRKPLALLTGSAQG